MEIKFCEDYRRLSRQAVEDWVQCLQHKPDALVCVASGDSPAGMYHHLAELVQSGKADISGWSFLGLDEWLGMNGRDEGSCRYHLDRQLFQPLGVPEERICFFDGRAADPEAECRRAEQWVKERGGLDLVVLGLGLNGHIGMNEPGTDPSTRCHIAELDELTIQTGQKYFSRATPLSGGLTLGIGTILEARNILLLVSGAKKAAVVRRLVEEEVSAALPASYLKTHAATRLYLDREAASLLPGTTTSFYDHHH